MWTVQLLGGLVARSPERTATRFRTQKAASLLAYLAFHCRPDTPPRQRETLVDMLWPDSEFEAGRHKLSTELSSLRLLLEPPGYPPGSVVVADRFAVGLNPATMTTDVARFEAAIDQAQQDRLTDAERLPLLLKAIELFQGLLLPGFYEEWIVPEATRLSGLFLEAAGRAVPLLLEQGASEQAVEVAQRAVAVDPLSEEALRALLVSLASVHQSVRALEAYRAYARRLRAEWEEEPSQELQEYARRLKQEAASNREPGPLPEAAPPISFAPTRGSLPRSKRAGHKTVPAREGTEREPMPVLPRGPETLTASRLHGEAFFLLTATRFFGREHELAQLAELLHTPRTRLVTLTGTGGTGKTRLALELAAHLLNANQPPQNGFESALFVPLADVADAGSLYESILRALQIPPEPKTDLRQQLRRQLSRQPDLLLILDNFEHLVEEGAELVRELLVGTPASLRCLVTSRQKLLLEGEQEFPLAPLSLSPEANTPAEMLDSPSVALFVDRAQTVKPDFQLTERNAGVVAQLCERLEGIPLAIELAAARIQLLSPARILEQIEANRLDFLSTRRRDAVLRHRTLRATLDWSYALLPPSAQAFLMQLGVFRGGWTLEAAEAVCQVKHGETLELLGLLRDNSLVSVVDTEEGVRFVLLETVREYASERLERTGQRKAVHQRHLDYFLRFADDAAGKLQGLESREWFERLEAEHDNLRAALSWCLGAESREAGTGKRAEAEASKPPSCLLAPAVETGFQLAVNLSHFWDMRGYWREGLQHLTRLLGQEGGNSLPSIRAAGLYAAGILSWRLCDTLMARRFLEESLAIRQQLGEQQDIATALHCLGIITLRLNNMDTARSYFEQALRINREIGNRSGEATTLRSLGNVVSAEGEYSAGRACYEQSLAIFRDLGDRNGEAACLTNMGYYVRDLGDFKTAQSCFERALAINRAPGHLGAIASDLSNLGETMRLQGDCATARSYLEQALELNRDLEHKEIQAEVLLSLGRVAQMEGDFRQARASLQQSLYIYRQVGFHMPVATPMEAFAELLALQQETRSAVRLYGAAQALRERLHLARPPILREPYQARIEALRSALGEAGFSRAWEEGTALTVEEAIESVLEDTGLGRSPQA
jgi:predicted ATPase/DNA-binding SARP family transcriptional activator